MTGSDFYFFIQWWLLLFIIGVGFFPLTSLVFDKFYDKGYIFAKVIGIIAVSYATFILGISRLVPFTKTTVILVFILLVALSFLPELLTKGNLFNSYKRIRDLLKNNWKILLLEEIIFFATLLLWTIIRGHQPDIHGLEKYMDFGFVNSILRSTYFPPVDMWFPPFSINYYYFGHLETAVLTKASGIPSAISYNLMIATLFAFTFTQAFSLGLNFLTNLFFKTEKENQNRNFKTLAIGVGGSFLTGILVSLSGNLHTIYALFSPYINEKPAPLWTLQFLPESFPNGYWYPNATRFIFNTIHEFPIYSFVVSDLHGHVLDIPVVLLIIAFLYKMLLDGRILRTYLFILGFLMAVMYMTNVWDGIIYLLLSILVIFYITGKTSAVSFHTQRESILMTVRRMFQGSILSKTLFSGILIIVIFIIFSLPFSVFFKPFASGIGILCAPSFLTELGKLGPFLFEANHCTRSPLWQLVTLYGFFYFWVASFILFLIKRKEVKLTDVFVLFLIFLSTLLIIIPEFIYLKDIYPAHYRANTMFKLVYQAFIMLSLSSGYIVVRLAREIKVKRTTLVNKLFTLSYLAISGLILYFVLVYPYFAVMSYYDGLRQYKGQDGVKYLGVSYPTDYEAIVWIEKNVKGQPVIAEAQGDSYTDYARVSSNTGLPTILGWTVHEWLWRGTYDIPSPRIADVASLYETTDINTARQIIRKYDVSLIFVGDLEREKYPSLSEEKFQRLGGLVYENGKTRIYQVNAGTL